ncbi:MAG: flagellar biosynthetic protein FliQ [Micavibrio sp.]
MIYIIGIMNQTEIIEVVREAILISIQLGTPVMMIGLVVGLAIALLQALTQIQEITLVFVPKIVAMMLAIFVLFPGFVVTLIGFTQALADRMVALN